MSVHESGEETYLPKFVRGLRERADPQALGVELYGARRRRGRGLRQAEMARLMGITETWYQKLESGAALWSEKWVAAFAQILDLPSVERLVLYKLALDWTPESVCSIAGVSEANKAAVDSFRVPAWLLDHVYKVRWRNNAAAHLLSELRPGDNLMSWILASPVARKRLVNWKTDWAIPSLAQLRTACALAELHLKPELEAIIDVACLASEEVAELWEHDRSYYLTPTGEKRRVMANSTDGDGRYEEVTVQLWTARPELTPGWTILTMEPISGA